MLRMGKINPEAAKALSDRVMRVGRSRRTHRVLIGVLVFIALFGLVTWLVVPRLVRNTVTAEMSAWLGRPVSVGTVGFNPYTLRLDVDAVHIGERQGPQAQGPQPFVDIGHLHTVVGWSSVFRLSPIVKELRIDRLNVHVVRTAEQRFNFTDLMEKIQSGPKSDKPLKFAVSNIQLTDSTVNFDDQVLNTHHTVDHIQLGIPFVANRPSDVDIFVKPLLAMSVDGSPLRLDGQTRPFATTMDSTINLNVSKLDLPRYLAYSPQPLPVKIDAGQLTTNIQLQFVNTTTEPRIQLSGWLIVEGLDVRDRNGAALATLRRGALNMTDVQPLADIYHLKSLYLSGLDTRLTMNADGSNNFSSLTSAPTAPAANKKADKPADLSLGTFDLSDSTVALASGKAASAITGIHLQVRNIHTPGTAPAAIELTARMGDGSLAMKGSVDIKRQHIVGDAKAERLSLPSLQGFAAPDMNAVAAAGLLGVQTHMDVTLADAGPNGHLSNLIVALEDVALQARADKSAPVQWKSLTAAISDVDLAAHRASVTQIKGDGLQISVLRRHNGTINLASLAPSAPPPGRAAPPASGPAWQAQVAAIDLEGMSVHYEDDSLPRKVKQVFEPMAIHLKDVGTDPGKPFQLTLQSTVNGKGSLHLEGNVTQSPLKAELKVQAKGLDLAVADTYVAQFINARIASAGLTADGKLSVATVGKDLRMGYTGNATLGNLRLLDKVTSEDFVRWSALSATHMVVKIGQGAPSVHIGALALSGFYGRVILNANGKLNLVDLPTTPETAATAITQAQPADAKSVKGAVVPPPSAVTAATGQPIADSADISIGQITLQGGNINYTDNFIKPNYTADLTDIGGKIGAIGTKTTTPADVVLEGQVNSSAPLAINGSVSPLTPTAFLDIKAKAEGVELTNLSAYSAKYAGYPIIKGTLTVDLQYKLDQGKLSADNHIEIDQLTFGDKVESSSATKLPVRLAVALLKDSRGVIDVHVPVSGSLADPQFSMGGVIWHAFLNLLERAATSPFRLLGAAFGGGAGGAEQDLGYIEFDPGRAKLSAESTQKLDTLVKALTDRPSLKLSITGRVDPEADRQGLREASLDHAMKVQKLKDTVGKGSSVDPETIEITPDEYDKYLEDAYKAADFAKPRDFIGLHKSLPADEMKKLMVTNAKVTDDDLKQLADQRASAAREYLSHKVEPGRLFVVPPTLDAKDIKDKGKTTRVDFGLQ
jgi:hypothetical protein